MTDFFQSLAQTAVPIFVVASLFNVGLTQKPAKLGAHLRNWHYLVRMIVINLIVVPALMLFAVEIVELDPVYAAGLLLFGMCAGAPFLIKLTAVSENDIALGATVLMVLMAATVVAVPLLLPLLVEDIDVDAAAIVISLLKQMVAPMVTGMLLTHFAVGVARAVQPWVAKISNIALYVVIAATLIGYLGDMADPKLWKAVATGLAVVFLAFLVGYMMGDGFAQLKDVGGLSTAQRGTAAAMIVATQNFSDPRIFVVVNIVNALGIVMLIAIAKKLSRDNRLIALDPQGADTP